MEKIKLYNVYLFLESKNFSVHISKLFSSPKTTGEHEKCSPQHSAKANKKKPLEDGPVSPETAVLQTNRSMGLTNENAPHSSVSFESRYKD